MSAAMQTMHERHMLVLPRSRITVAAAAGTDQAAKSCSWLPKPVEHTNINEKRSPKPTNCTYTS